MFNKKLLAFSMLLRLFVFINVHRTEQEKMLRHYIQNYITFLPVNPFLFQLDQLRPDL